MKIKVSEAAGPVLDHMVHIVIGLTIREDFKYGRMYYRPQTKPDEVAWENVPLPYSTDWSQGGPIIEREGIDIYHREASTLWSAAIWRDLPGGGQLMCKQRDCPTPLIAAMRCFVASKLGDEVEVSDELTS